MFRVGGVTSGGAGAGAENRSKIMDMMMFNSFHVSSMFHEHDDRMSRSDKDTEIQT